MLVIKLTRKLTVLIVLAGFNPQKRKWYTPRFMGRWNVLNLSCPLNTHPVAYNLEPIRCPVFPSSEKQRYPLDKCCYSHTYIHHTQKIYQSITWMLCWTFYIICTFTLHSFYEEIILEYRTAYVIPKSTTQTITPFSAQDPFWTKGFLYSTTELYSCRPFWPPSWLFQM